MFQNSNYNYKVDIWGLGILFYEMLHGFPPDAYSFVLNKNELKMDETLTKNARELIVKLLKFNPQERLNLVEIFQNEWLLSFEDVFNIKIQEYVTIKKKKIEDRFDGNKENLKKKDSLELNSRTEMRVLCAKSLNKCSENFDIIEKNSKKFKSNYELKVI